MTATVQQAPKEQGRPRPGGDGRASEPAAPEQISLPRHLLSAADLNRATAEHVLSTAQRLEQAIAAHLGEPLEDPHGHPIPTREGQLTRRQLQPLSLFRAGEHVIIREAQDDNPDRLRTLFRDVLLRHIRDLRNVIHLINSGSYEGIQDLKLLVGWRYQPLLNSLMFAACSVPYRMYKEELKGVWPFLPDVSPF